MTLNHPHVKDDIVASALKAKFTNEEIKLLEDYSNKIEKNGALVVFDEDHLSKLLGYDIKLLYSISNSSKHYYRSFQIPKRNGKLRTIDEPLPTLKEIQRYILDNILSNVEVSKASKAFKAKCDIKKNARIHLRQKEILSTDIKDFFSSISIKLVFLMFQNLGYTKSLSMLLAKLCCLNDRLPQGAPTSPAISNIIFRELDQDLLLFCQNSNLRYTRYADDITISGEKVGLPAIKEVRKSISTLGLKLNGKKTRIMRNSTRKVVTGIIVNIKMQAPRELRKSFRQNVYYIRKFGIDGHLVRIGEKRKNYLRHLIGVGEFIVWVDKKNTEAAEDVKFLKDLMIAYHN